VGAGLDPAQPVTGPSRWPGWAEQHACANARVLLQCASELKFTCTEPMVIKLTKKQRFAYLVLETEDAYSADGSSSAASLYLPSALTCLRVPFVFSATLKLRRLWRGWPAGNWLVGNLFWFWVFVVCRDEGNGRANTRLCVLLLSCSLCLSVYYFFLLIYTLFFLCSFLRFLVFCMGLASVFSSPAFFIFYRSWFLLCLPCLWFFCSSFQSNSPNFPLFLVPPSVQPRFCFFFLFVAFSPPYDSSSTVRLFLWLL